MLIFIDLETTGLDPVKHSIAQIACIAEESGQEFEVKVRFNPALADPEALAMGWYVPEVWGREAVGLEEALARWEMWLIANAPGSRWKRQLAGHFAAEFDKQFLLAAYKKTSRTFLCDFRVQDTMQLAMWLLPKRRSYKLPDLYRDIVGGTIDKSEGALGDVRATRLLVQRLRQGPKR